MRKFFAQLRRRFLAGVARQEDLDRLYDQVSGLLQIQNAMEGRPVLRPMRGWAISPDAMAWVLADLQGRESPTVIEFGSGQSTVILAAALRHCGGRLISVEHDPAYSAVIQRQVAACGLSSYVQTIDAPLAEPVRPEEPKSYDFSRLPDTMVDVALVDGPPWTNGQLTRLPPLRWTARHLNSGGVIFLDDALRDAEKSCVVSLKAEFPGLKVDSLQAEKGLVRLTR